MNFFPFFHKQNMFGDLKKKHTEASVKLGLFKNKFLRFPKENSSVNVWKVSKTFLWCIPLFFKVIEILQRKVKADKGSSDTCCGWKRDKLVLVEALI